MLQNRGTDRKRICLKFALLLKQAYISVMVKWKIYLKYNKPSSLYGKES